MATPNQWQNAEQLETPSGYALIAVLVSTAAFVAMGALGISVTNTFTSLTNDVTTVSSTLVAGGGTP